MADLNGDGFVDLIWRHSGGGISIWSRANDTWVDTWIGVIDTSWSIKAVADFDGDNKDDILWSHSGGGLALWKMDGATIVSSTFIGDTPVGWSIVGTGDFNGSGREQILLQHTGGGLAMWTMNGAVIEASEWITDLGTDGELVFKGIFDVNGDGHDDLLIRNTVQEVHHVWEMDGNDVVSSVLTHHDGSSGRGIGPTVAAVSDLNADGFDDVVFYNGSQGLNFWYSTGETLDGLFTRTWVYAGRFPDAPFVAGELDGVTPGEEIFYSVEQPPIGPHQPGTTSLIILDENEQPRVEATFAGDWTLYG